MQLYVTDGKIINNTFNNVRREAGLLMAYDSISLEKRLKDNIKTYNLTSLFDLDVVSQQVENLYKLFGINIMITDRHGEKNISFGHFIGYHPDVVNDPGIKLKIEDRTIAHVYVNYDHVNENQMLTVKLLFENMLETFKLLGEKTYFYKETAIYADELEEKLEKETYQVKHGEKQDPLTGVLNKTYFENRLKIVDRSQIAPVAAICLNINDWKFVNEHFGDEESDRLIQIIAEIIKEKAKPEYIVGRVDGDVFNVLIPMPDEDECDSFCKAVRDSCEGYEDLILAPSVAIGTVMKENVEESLTELLSDAEFEMFEDKLEMKNAPGYKERLVNGL